MVAPDLIDAEALSVLRGLERSGQLTTKRAEQALSDLMSAPIRRVPTVQLLADAWALRSNLSAYDACYAALALSLDRALVTADHRLAGAASRLATSVLLV